jgi:hypothetical protein
MNMKIVLVSMRKYKMCLGWKYRLKNFISISKMWSGEIIQFRILCEYGFDIDLRQGSFIDKMLTDKEKRSFWLRMDLLKRKN